MDPGRWGREEEPERLVDEEFRFHLTGRAAELVSQGMSPEEARAEAAREFGDVEATRAYCARQDRWHALAAVPDRLLRATAADLGSALRSLVRRPERVAAPLAVLAVGIALNALVFTVVNSVLLAPLPFLAPQRVRVLEEVEESGGLARTAYPVLARWREDATTLEVVAAYSDGPFPVVAGDTPAQVWGAAVTEGFFDLLDDPILVGRPFGPEDHLPGAPRRVLVSESLWRRILGGRDDVLGSTLRMNGEAYDVIGVVSSERVFPDASEVWVALESTNPALVEMAGAKILVALARVRPGVAANTVDVELSRLTAAAPEGAPAARAVPVASRLLGHVRTPLLLLQGAVLLVLLAACANAGGMLLTRSMRRGPELAVRISLGAGRWRVASTLLLEGLALGISGGLAGLTVAAVLLEPTLSLVPTVLPRADGIHLGWGVAAVALGLSAVTGVVTALGPALAATRLRPAGLLRQGFGAAGFAPWLHRTLDGLVVGQIALAVLLTGGAGLLLRSFLATLAENPGFDPTRVTVLDVSLPQYAYPDDTARLSFARELLDRSGSLPGARAVALGKNLPITGRSMTSPLVVEGVEGITSAVQIAKATEDYFEVMGIELVQGSGFAGEDRPGGLPRLVVTEGIRAPDGRPLTVGDRSHSFFGKQEMREVVGIARAVRHQGLREAPVPLVYEPFFQSGGDAAFSLLIRSDAPASVVARAARLLVAELDPELPTEAAVTMSDHIRRSLAEPRFYTVGLTVFGLLAVLLALAGCEAGLAHRVAAGRREFGLRMALGASGRAVRSMVVKRGLVLTALGGVIGTLAAVPSSRILENQLYGVQSGDPFTHGAVLLLLLAAGALASDLPARRAAKVDPAETLREV